MDPSMFAGLPTQIGTALDFAGSWLSNERAKDASKKAYKRAKEFAQSGIQWRVADANAAGINPYFALGAPTATYSDMVGGGGSPLGETLSNMGQNISRAALANSPAPDKMAAALQPLALERAGLENDYLRAKIASEQRLMSQAGSYAGLPGGAIGGEINTDPLLNERLQKRHGEMADVITAPHTAVELLRQPGAILDPNLSPRVAAAIREAIVSTWRRGSVPNTYSQESW